MSIFEGIVYASYALLFGGPFISVKLANGPDLKWWALTLLISYGVIIGAPIVFPNHMNCSEPSACMGAGLAWIGSVGLGVLVNIGVLAYAATRIEHY